MRINLHNEYDRTLYHMFDNWKELLLFTFWGGASNKMNVFT